MNRVWHADTTKDLRTKWIDIINQLNDQWRVIQGPGNAESQSLVNGSQASVIQISAPETAGTLAPVGEGQESEAVSPDSAPASKGILSPSPALDTRPTARITSPEAHTTSTATSPKVRPTSRDTSPEAPLQPVRRQPGVVQSPQHGRSERSASEYPDPPSPVHVPLPPPRSRSRRTIQESDSEEESVQPPSRARSASTKASSKSSKEEVDQHILVEDSQPESAESASSVLFSGDEARHSGGEARHSGADRSSGVQAQDAARDERTPVHDSSDDGRGNGRIDLSSDQGYSADVRPSPRRRRNRDSSRFDRPSSSAPLSSPPPEDTTRPDRRRSRGRESLPAQPKQKQAKMSAYMNGAKRPAEPQPQPQPHPQERQRPERPEPHRDQPHASREVVVQISKPSPVKHTYKEKGKRKVSGAAAPGGTEAKRPRPSHDPAAGGSSEFPIDLDPSDEE